MKATDLTRFSPRNQRQLIALLIGHLLWSALLLVLWSVGLALSPPAAGWSLLFLLLQFYAAVQLLLPLQRLQAEQRSRLFYLFWGGLLGLLVWLSGRLVPTGSWQPLAAAGTSSLLLLAGSLIGMALARFVKRLWEILPLCLVMSLADFTSWLLGPTANFAQQIESYYRAPSGPPPLVDLLLVKLAYPGGGNLLPVFGISDWIIAVFFVGVARQHGFNDNLAGPSGEQLARHHHYGRYLPLPLTILLAVVLTAQLSGHFIPALPAIALGMLLWLAFQAGRARLRA